MGLDEETATKAAALVGMNKGVCSYKRRAYFYILHLRFKVILLAF